MTNLLPRFNEWGVNCRTCRYSRKVGAAPNDAKRLARRHTHAHPDHEVEVIEYLVRQVWGGPQPHLILQTSDDPPY